MLVKWLGHSSFVLKFDNLTVVTDPYDSYVGYDMPEVSADVVTVSHHHADHDNVKAVSGSPIVLDKADSFESAGVKISAIETYHDKESGRLRGKTAVFKFQGDGVTVCHMGDVGGVFPDVADFIRGAGVLLIPVGGNYTVDAFDALSYVLAARPAIVVPMHYKTEDCLFDIDKIDSFIELFDTDHVHFLGENNFEADKNLLTAYPDTQIIVLKK